jgi:ATP-dependent HslUV protease subunit HslV
LIVGDGESILVLSGEGDVIEPDDGIAAIGSGAPYATAAAKALMTHTDLSAREIVESAMQVTSELCIFTNDRFTIETVTMEGVDGEGAIDESEASGTEPEQLTMPSEGES